MFRAFYRKNQNLLELARGYIGIIICTSLGIIDRYLYRLWLSK